MSASPEDIFLHQKASVKQVMTMDLSNRKVVIAVSRYAYQAQVSEAAEPQAAAATQQLQQQLQQAYQLLRGAGHRQTLAPATLPAEDSLAQAKLQVAEVWQQLFSQQSVG